MGDLFFVLSGVGMPLLGTTLGAGTVFFLKKGFRPSLAKILFGLAAGVMLAAGLFSLLIPAAELAESRGLSPALPTCTGFLAGSLLFWGSDVFLAKRERAKNKTENKLWSMILAVTLHNLPEGMAVGVILAGALQGGSVSRAAALALSLGIAIQNFPEGAIISLPLMGVGVKKGKSFLLGFLSGLVEPVGAVLTLVFTGLITPILPYVLAFAAGAMVYVVAQELIPELGEDGEESRLLGDFALIGGFVLMMALDLMLG